jgi:hypothetical protein
MRVLVVKGAFGGHSRGSRIIDPAEIDKILAGENAHQVIQSNHPDEVQPREFQPEEVSDETSEQEQE